MIVDIDIEPDNFGNVWLIGEANDSSLSIRQYVDLIAMMVGKLDEIDPMKVYRREWEE